MALITCSLSPNLRFGPYSQLQCDKNWRDANLFRGATDLNRVALDSFVDYCVILLDFCCMHLRNLEPTLGLEPRLPLYNRNVLRSATILADYFHVPTLSQPVLLRYPCGAFTHERFTAHCDVSIYQFPYSLSLLTLLS